jgi:hypothetical protein
MGLIIRGKNNAIADLRKCNKRDCRPETVAKILAFIADPPAESLYILPENKKKPGPSAEGTQRRIASIRRAITSRAMERIKQGLSAESANDAPTRFAQRELEQQLQDTARQLDPIEQALTKVRRTRIVFRASVYGGPHNRFYISGRDRETISEQELLKLARKVA